MLDLAMEVGAVRIGLILKQLLTAHRDTLFVDLLPADSIQRDGIGGEVHRLVLPDVLRSRAGSTVPHALDAVEHVQDCFVADHRQGDNGRNEGAADVLRLGRMTAVYVVHQTMGQVLQCQRHAGRLVLLQHARFTSLLTSFVMNFAAWDWRAVCC